jgi:hypothetical protein
MVRHPLNGVVATDYQAGWIVGRKIFNQIQRMQINRCHYLNAPRSSSPSSLPNSCPQQRG